MGTSKKPHTKLTKMASPLDLPTEKMRGRANMPSVEKFIKDGLDAIYAVYPYAEFLEAIADPSHEEHERMLTWSGPFDPEAFNPAAATKRMKRGLPDWRKMERF